MTYYPSNYNPYQNQNNTGAAAMLAEHHRSLLQASQDRQVENLQWRVQDLNQQIREMQRAPRPSVEVTDHTPSWWSKLFSDPIWEIFKRPKINP